MSTVGQGALRRTTNISTGSSNNSSTENNNYLVPNNTKQLTSQPNLLLDTQNFHNLQPPIINEMSTATTPPSTPSKHKTYNPFSFRKQRKPFSGSISLPTSRLDFKNIFFFLIFLCAILFFLCSLFGIGPVDEELLIVTDTMADGLIFDDDLEMKNDDINIDLYENEVNPWEQSNWNIEGEDNVNLVEENVDYPLNVDNNNYDDNKDEVFENGIIFTTDEKPTDQPNNIENIIITENISSIAENFISTPSDITEDMTNENDLEFTEKPKIKLTQKKITNKLRKKKKTEYDTNTNMYNTNSGSFDEYNITVDYVNYKYIVAKPHFTHTDIIESLSNEQNKEFAKLQRLQKNIDDSLDYSCGSWQEGYTKLHKEIINGNATQRYVGFVCDAKMNCGSLADRILGMASTFLFALLTDRAFLSDWQAPLPLDAIFESPNIDWSYDSFNPSNFINDLNTTELNIIDYDSQDLDNHFSLTNWTTRYPDPFIKFYTNQGLIQRTFDSKHYSTKLKEIGLKPFTAFGCIIDYLFRPVPPALSFITHYTALFALPNIFSVGIHIRTGNVYKQALSLQDYSHFFICANQITRTYAAPDKKVIYYLVTDSIKLRREAYLKLSHVIISGFPIVPGHDFYDHADGVNDAIVENWILSKTDYRVISQSDFGKLAAFHSKQPHSTVLLSNTEKNYLDCTHEDAFTTFNEFSDE